MAAWAHQIVCIHGVTSVSSALRYEPFCKGLEAQLPRLEFHLTDWRHLGFQRRKASAGEGPRSLEVLVRQGRRGTLAERYADYLHLLQNEVAPGHPSWSAVSAPFRTELELVGWALDYVADIELYLRDETTRAAIHDYIWSILKVAAKNGPVTVVAHSLGSVIALQVIHEHMAPGEVILFVTLGSPLELLLYLLSGTGLVTYSLELPKEVAWINFYDIKDLFASRLVTGDFDRTPRDDWFVQLAFGLREHALTRPDHPNPILLNDFWAVHPVEDVRLNVALNRYPTALLAHTAYWHCNAVYRATVELVAGFLPRLGS
jgi:hypothetical protein